MHIVIIVITKTDIILLSIINELLINFKKKFFTNLSSIMFK